MCFQCNASNQMFKSSVNYKGTFNAVKLLKEPVYVFHVLGNNFDSHCIYHKAFFGRTVSTYCHYVRISCCFLRLVYTDSPGVCAQLTGNCSRCSVRKGKRSNHLSNLTQYNTTENQKKNNSFHKRTDVTPEPFDWWCIYSF